MSDDFGLSWVCLTRRHGIVRIDRRRTSVHGHNDILEIFIEDEKCCGKKRTNLTTGNNRAKRATLARLDPQ